MALLTARSGTDCSSGRGGIYAATWVAYSALVVLTLVADIAISGSTGRKKKKMIQVGARQAQRPFHPGERDPSVRTEILTTLAKLSQRDSRE